MFDSTVPQSADLTSVPVVTIVIPVYLLESHLRGCLINIKQQTFTDWECIVIDDGSKEPELIDAITKEIMGGRARVIHQKNQGLSAARNAGIQLSRTKLIMCLDPDDCLHPEYLEEIIPTFSIEDVDVVYCWARFLGAKQGILSTTQVNLFDLLSRNLIVSSTIFKQDVWEALNGFDVKMRNGHEDWEFWIRALLAGYKFHGIHRVLFDYHISTTGMNTKATARRVNTIHYIRHKHRKIYFMPLHTLWAYPAFSDVPRSSLIRFWLSNLFFHYLPRPLRNGLFEVYRRFNT